MALRFDFLRRASQVSVAERMRELANVAQSWNGCKVFNVAHGTLKREKRLYFGSDSVSDNRVYQAFEKY
ncbi:MAG: hypothetical protein WAN10_01170 [Candidatus Acidiferrales bacterium]